MQKHRLIKKYVYIQKQYNDPKDLEAFEVSY